MLGEPIYLSFTIRNNSAEDLAVIVGGDRFNWLRRPERFTVEAVRDNGVQVQPRELPPGRPGGNDSVGPQKIPANGSYSFSLFLPDWVEFQAPGRYTLTAARTLDIGKYGRDASWQNPANLVHIDVRADVNVSVVPTDNATLGEVIAARGRELLGADEAAALAAAKALAAMDDERASDPFIRALAQSGYSVKFAAISALARFKTGAALAALQRAVGDPDPNIRTAAGRSLELRTARDAADAFIRKSEMPQYYAQPVFLRMDDRGDEIWVVYKKTFEDERRENPADLTVAYNKATGAARWVLRE
jgi:hypothetical protein